MYLDEIVAATRRRLAARKGRFESGQVQDPPRGFGAALARAGFGVIAEIKRASPSRGWLNAGLDVPSLARAYERGGAVALSVLTESQFFHGSFLDLEVARRATALPVLCKDFILEASQVHEARSHGADAVLLIAAILSDSELKALVDEARGLGMDALVEVHDRAEVEKALGGGAELIGINNRNLRTFQVDLTTSLELASTIPSHIPVVSESGIVDPGDIIKLRRAGAKAVLVGEALVTSPDPEAKLRELLGAGAPGRG
jgi:indole-3-glycerol phosphate synthase